MGRTVDELSRSITMDELAAWHAYDTRFPVSTARMFDVLFANLCATILASNGAKKAGGGRFTIDDCLMFKRPSQIKPREFMTRLFGGRIVKRSK